MSILEAQSPAASVPLMTTFDATWDAMKCAMKISLIQLSKYHNNQISCCGLWMVKWFMKTSAEKYCERPDGAKAVFDQYINGDLIYNQMVRSVLGDDQLSCEKYPEGSATCSRLWIFIFVITIILSIVVILIIVWCCCATIFWCRTRRENYQLKSKINTVDMFSNHTRNNINTIESNNKNHTPKSNNHIRNNFIRSSQVHESSPDKVPIPIEDIGYNDNIPGNLKV